LSGDNDRKERNDRAGTTGRMLDASVQHVPDLIIAAWRKFPVWLKVIVAVLLAKLFYTHTVPIIRALISLLY